MSQLSKLVYQTINASLAVQIITTLVSLDGFRYPTEPRDSILKEILFIEVFVQFVEGFFYTWIIQGVHDFNLMTQRRYFDWMITTPVMLFSTILFFEYSKKKEQNNLEGFTSNQFYTENSENVQKLIIYNGLMLLFGYLGETGMIDKRISIPIGFIFFFASFELIYKEYAVYSQLGTQLFKVLFTIWFLYGVAAMFPPELKNISYNLLDIVSKNFYGLYIYYKIRELQ